MTTDMMAAAEARQMDLQVAEAVMGWTWWRWGVEQDGAPRAERFLAPADYDELGWMSRADGSEPISSHRVVVPPPFTSDPAADYQVLAHVRSTWSPEMKHLFAQALAGFCKTYHLLWCYVPGMYARAALVSVRTTAELGVLEEVGG